MRTTETQAGNGHDRDAPWTAPRRLTLLHVDDEYGPVESLRQLMRAAIADRGGVLDPAPGGLALVSRLGTVEGVEWWFAAAPSGTAALEICEHVAVDVAVVDLRLGIGMDGLELVSRLRRRWPRMRVAVLTAFGDRDTEAAVAAAGVPLHRKPEDVPALLAWVAGA